MTIPPRAEAASADRRSNHGRWLILAKLLVSGAILALVLSRIDLAAAVGRITGANPAWLAVALAALALQIVTSSLRWQRVLLGLEESPRFAMCVQLTWLGQFFNQGFPSVVAGDAARIWYMRPHVGSLGRLLTSVVLDRLTGFLAIALLIVAALPWLIALLPPGAAAPALIVATAGVVVALAALWLLSGAYLEAYIRWPRLVTLHRHLQSARHVLAQPAGLLIVVLALLVQALSVLAVAALALALEVPLTLGQAFMFVPVVMLLAMLPVSIAGWGVREGAMVVALGMAGIAATESAALAILLGLLMALIALPGGLILLRVRRGRSARSDAADG
ncbi:MAG: lysylphosphatidylglycerol synthase transmembrane domain-containing protein [Alphaproteobacteria bacterium]